jgi:hypothetical protein
VLLNQRAAPLPLEHSVSNAAGGVSHASAIRNARLFHGPRHVHLLHGRPLLGRPPVTHPTPSFGNNPAHFFFKMVVGEKLRDFMSAGRVPQLVRREKQSQ